MPRRGVLRCGTVLALAALFAAGGCGAGEDTQAGAEKPVSAYPATGWPVIHRDSRTGATLDEEPISGVEFATMGTSMSEDGRVYVPGFLSGLWAFAPAAR